MNGAQLQQFMQKNIVVHYSLVQATFQLQQLAEVLKYPDRSRTRQQECIKDVYTLNSITESLD
jgi:hypothetical protein